MDSKDLSRRSFVLAGAGVVLAAGNGPITAADVIARIKKNVGVPWRAETVDRIVAGDAETPVSGIATTMMATLDVLQRASAAGKNMVVTHEPTFYSHQDKTEGLAGDETYRYKADFIRGHHMVVFHFHDHWHARRPDGIADGMARELGWQAHADSPDLKTFQFPETRLAHLAKDIAARLKIHTMRVVGDPNLPVRRVTTSWGYLMRDRGMELLSRPDVDVLIAGETWEWELVEWAQDAITMGKKKALILLGHVVSEQAGMKYCAEWLKPFVPEVPVEFVPATEPFWRPEP